jgi:hypothetical protein
MAATDKLITVVGDEVVLHVESEEPFLVAPGATGSPVEVQYVNVPVDTGPRPSAQPGSPPPKIAFTEQLVAEPASLRDPPLGKFAFSIKWKVNLNKDPKLEAETAVLQATVRGRAVSGTRQIAAIRDLLFVQVPHVTTDPKLTRIMLHEFAKETAPGSGTFAFDPAPAEAFLRGLTLQQKKLLCDTATQVTRAHADDASKPKGKLVVFITLYDPDKKKLRMAADNLEARQAVRANATFSVFHCGDPAADGSPPDERGVVLVCHTEHFVVNMANTHKGGTSAWIRTPVRGRTPNQYMDKATPKPVKYHVAALRPSGGSDQPRGGVDPRTGVPKRGTDQYGVIWHGFYHSNGKNLMSGNTLHGMINTHGCWMLFRNYNWPEGKRNDFDDVYRTVLRREKKLTPKVQFALDQLGYDVAATDLAKPNVESSFIKFASFDRNFAYLWFHHEVLGIKYFSQSFVLRDARDRVLPSVDDNTRANDLDPHGRTVRKSFPVADPSRKPKFTGPDETGFTYHDPSVRRASDPTFRDTDAVLNALFVDNALGYRVSQGFVGFVAEQLTKDQLVNRSWADVYFYRDGDVDLTRAAFIGTNACIDTSAPTQPPQRFVKPK